ncbi:Hpt domain-containing protein [Massilia sp.]|uniref:Hpt domain-containing protein n=1 Tax=Massilia sp. TaxID=1882437 RepID=UPI00391C1AE3
MSLSPSPAAPEAHVPVAMPALDCAAGRDRMMGDEAMYLRVLARFRSDYADTAARLRTALAAGDATLAHRIAHTLKGAAAMVEARCLRALALEVEQLLRAGAPADAPLLERLEAELARVIDEVALLLAPSAVGPAASDATLAPADLAHLRSLLDLGDSGAQDLMAEKRGPLRAYLGAARMAQLESALAAFDYERALSVLDAP